MLNIEGSPVVVRGVEYVAVEGTGGCHGCVAEVLGSHDGLCPDLPDCTVRVDGRYVPLVWVKSE